MNATRSALLKKLGLSTVLVAALAGGLAGCDRDGPAEQAGENIDKAATDVGNAIEDKCEKAKEGMGAEDTRC